MSSYRDDRDALRGRVQTLEEDLATSQKALQESQKMADGSRVEELERRMGDARRIIDGLQHELDGLRPKPVPRSNLALPIVGGACAIAMIAGATALMVRPKPSARSRTVVAAQTPAAETPVTPPAPLSPPSPVKPVLPQRKSIATWTAKVTNATGAAIAVGTRCVLNATLAGNGESLDVAGLEALCGDKPIYRSADALNGVSMQSSGVDEEPGPAGGLVYASLRWEDKGTRTGARSQISVTSSRRAAAVWSDTAPAFHVDLAIEPKSAPVPGPAMLEGTARALRTALVASAVTGPAPVKKGASCAIFVVPSKQKCPVRIDCGSVVLYGAEGSISPCTLEDGLVVRASDPEVTSVDRDPALSLDVADKHARVWDGDGPTAWSVELDFVSPK